MVPCLRLGNVLYRIETESDQTIVNTDRNLVWQAHASTIELEDYDSDAAQQWLSVNRLKTTSGILDLTLT